MGVLIDKAMAGDMAAAKLLLDKELRKPADRRISVPMRPIRSKQDVVEAKADVSRAMAEGRITPAEADAFLKLLGDIISAPKVPRGVVDRETLDQAMQRLLPELERCAAERAQAGGETASEHIGLYEIWVEMSERHRASRSSPLAGMPGIGRSGGRHSW